MDDLKLDLLVIAVHPDDAELCCGGTIIKHAAAGKRVGIVDLTRGELGTRGTAETRDQEAAAATRLMGLTLRENLRMRDGFFRNDEQHQLQVIQVIRKYRPEMVISNARTDRHPDHGRAGDLVNDAVFLAGLRKIETTDNGKGQLPYRPKLLLQSIQDTYITPDVVVDVSDFWERKLEVLRAYKTQFFSEAAPGGEPQTYISDPGFFDIINGRGREYGKHIGARFAEGFTCRRLIGVDDLFVLK